MKAIVCICLIGMVAVALARPNEKEEEKYTSKYDDVNLDEIISNDRLFDPYLNCVLDLGRCAPDAKELKSHIREALENDCAKCNDKQKEGVRKVIKHLINEKNKAWQDLVAKYDPDHKYSKKYEAELKSVTA